MYELQQTDSTEEPVRGDPELESVTLQQYYDHCAADAKPSVDTAKAVVAPADVARLKAALASLQVEVSAASYEVAVSDAHLRENHAEQKYLQDLLPQLHVALQAATDDADLENFTERMAAATEQLATLAALQGDLESALDAKATKLAALKEQLDHVTRESQDHGLRK